MGLVILQNSEGGNMNNWDRLCNQFIYLSVAIILAFVSYRSAGAESQLASQVLKAVSKVSDSIVTILLGLIVLITVISLVRSGLSAQINVQFQKRFGLSREIIMVLETVTIFVLAMIALPLLKKLMAVAVSSAGSQSVMLGDNFHLPDY